MDLGILKQCLAVLIIPFALAAAFCWYRAATSSVGREEAERIIRERNERNGESWMPASITIGDDDAEDDLAMTLALQAKWNRQGALFAATAAVAQAAYTFVAEFVINS